MIFYKKKYNREEWHDYFALIPVRVKSETKGYNKFACFKTVQRRSKLVGFSIDICWKDEYRLKEC